MGADAPRIPQRFQINDSLRCPAEAAARDERVLPTRMCLDGDATRLVTKEGVLVILLFVDGFVCYRVRRAAPALRMCAR